jgi:translation initiation factor 3 subunit J
VAAPVAPPKKKGTLKQKLAEKEAEKTARRAAGEDEEDSFDEDDVLDPRAKALRDKQRELDADLKNAADLFGQTSVNGMDSFPELLISVKSFSIDRFPVRSSIPTKGKSENER